MEPTSERLVVYVTPTIFERVERLVAAEDMTRPDWLRQTIVAAVESAERPKEPQAPEQGHLEVELATVRAKNEGLEQLLAQARERQGMSDSLNQEMSKRLEEAHATLSRLTVAALPAPIAGSDRPWWRFW